MLPLGVFEFLLLASRCCLDLDGALVACSYVVEVCWTTVLQKKDCALTLAAVLDPGIQFWMVTGLENSAMHAACWTKNGGTLARSWEWILWQQVLGIAQSLIFSLPLGKFTLYQFSTSEMGVLSLLGLVVRCNIGEALVWQTAGGQSIVTHLRIQYLSQPQRRVFAFWPFKDFNWNH